MSHAVIAVDGVLRKLVGAAPIVEGIRLYRSLAMTGHIILLAHEDATLTDWLELHGCTKHGFLRIARRDLTLASQVNQVRREGYDIGLVVVPDPEEATTLINAGFNTLLFTHARYSQPSWRPDADPGIQPWASITQQVADLARMKAADERLNPDD